MPAIKRFRPNMPSRKSADARSARFASDPVAHEEQSPHESTTTDEVAADAAAVENSQTVPEQPVVAPIVEPNQVVQETIAMPASTIVRQPWKQDSKQSKGYLGWAINSVSNLASFNVILAVTAASLMYYFFIWRKRGGSKNVPEVEEQSERKSEGPKSVRSSLKFKSPTMILGEIRKNPSVKVAPSIAKK